MDCDWFVLSMKTGHLVEDLAKLQQRKNIINFHTFNQKHPLCISIKKKGKGKLKIGTPDSLTCKEFVDWGSEIYSYTSDKMSKEGI